MRSTIGQIKDFRDSAIWEDITQELNTWLSQIHEQLENHHLVADHRELDRLGGCAEAVRNFFDIPLVLIGLSEDNQVERETILNNLIKGRK